MFGAKIEIEMTKCVGCKTCMNACFLDVIRWDQETAKPIAAYPEDCVWCLDCEMQCPAQCIEVIPRLPVGLADPY